MFFWVLMYSWMFSCIVIHWATRSNVLRWGKRTWRMLWNALLPSFLCPHQTLLPMLNWHGSPDLFCHGGWMQPPQAGAPLYTSVPASRTVQTCFMAHLSILCWHKGLVLAQHNHRIVLSKRYNLQFIAHSHIHKSGEIVSEILMHSKTCKPIWLRKTHKQ